ncbi:hypothetical protein GCM10023349_38700 [Nocardioides conyzicola]|uniref:Integral membrane protein n=1 Tax=Nocardioides conyzicola TaxID=1651781 RepID=A0ABP8XU30_9ACTN
MGMLLVLVGLVAGVANREVLDADRFASHVDAVRSDPDVARQVGALLTDRLIEDQPDLVAVRPLIESTAASVVASPALGPVVRAGVAPLYDALVLGDDGAVVLRLADVGAVVVGALAFAAPQASVPPDLDVRLSQVGGQEGSAVGAVHWVELLAWLCPLLGALLLGAAGALTSGPRSARVREAVRRVGVGVATAGLVLSGLLVVVGFWADRLSHDTVRGAVRHAVWRELDGPLWAAAGIAVALGALLAVAAGVTDWPRLRDVRGLVDLDRSPRRLAARAAVLGAVGVALVLQPSRVATVVLALLGVGLVAVAVVSLTVAIGRSPRRRTGVLAIAVALVAAVSLAAWPGDHELAAATSVAPREGCNGHVELCTRRYDEVAYPATHNSMAAASEPGWFFPEQPDGIVAQLDHGIRVLLIDSWYGQATDRPGVIAGTDAQRAASLAEAEVDLGPAAVRSAQRVRDAAGLTPQGPVEPYLCHALCELGSTHWLQSLRDVHAWLGAHPDEVVTFFVQDEVSPADTAALIEEAGLLPYVYTPVGDDWPTLGQMIASGKRLVVLMENHDGGTAYPWLMAGFEEAQDTPFLFRRPALLTTAASCAPNRGTPDASLFLLNHWVTDKTAEVTNAERVNAADVLLTRARACQRARGMLPNYVAVDFYDRGDLFAVVDELNGF